MNPRSDVAALGAAVIAVPLTLFTGEGPYGSFSIAISATLLALIFGYAYTDSNKSFAQNLATAAVVGLAAVPAIGAVYDIANGCEGESCFVEDLHTVAWVGASVIAFTFGKIVQARKKT